MMDDLPFLKSELIEQNKRTMKKLHALVLGATGATGHQIVKRLLQDSNYCKVSTFVRTKPNLSHEKLTIHQIDFSRLNDYKTLVNGDVLFSALGTTLKDAGSKDQQYLVDFTYQYEFAKMASENGVTSYSLVSSLGSNKNAPFFYPKIKGALEEAVKELNFKRIHIFQPPFLIRPPHLIRNGEKIGLKILKFFNQIRLLKSHKPLAVAVLAEKMIKEVESQQSLGQKTYKPSDIF